MTITYTWKITSLKVKDEGTLTNAVVQTYWSKTGVDEDGNEGTFSGATPFTVNPDDESGPFKPFDQLTEEDVLSWIKTVVVESYEEHVNGKIKEQIEAKKNPITDAKLPWQKVTDSPTPTPTP